MYTVLKRVRYAKEVQMLAKILNNKTHGILFKLTQYLKLHARHQYNPDNPLFDEFQRGVCTGYSALWGFAKSLSLEKPRQPGVDIARDDVEWFYSVIDALAQWDGKALPVYPSGNDTEVERLLSHLNFFQNPTQILQNSQDDLDNLMEKDSFKVRLVEKLDNVQPVINLDEICIIRTAEGCYSIGMAKQEENGYTYQEIPLVSKDVYQNKLVALLDLLHNKELIRFKGELFSSSVFTHHEAASYAGSFYTLLGRVVTDNGGVVSALRKPKKVFSIVSVVGKQQLISLLPEVVKENTIVLLSANDHMTAMIVYDGRYYYFDSEDPNARVSQDLNLSYRASEEGVTLDEGVNRIFKTYSTNADAQLVLTVSVFNWHKSHCYVNKIDLLSDTKYCIQEVDKSKISFIQNSPVLEATRMGDLESLDYWLCQTVESINTQNYMGFSPLFVAAQENKVSAAQAILNTENGRCCIKGHGPVSYLA